MAFMQAIDACTRELGERGKCMAGRVSEGVPPALVARLREPEPEPEPAPTPAPVHARARAPAPAPASAPAPAPAPDRSFTPSMQLALPAAVMQPRSTDDGLLAEVLLEQQKLMLEREKEMRQEAKAEKAELRQEMEGKTDELRQEMREDMQPATLAAAISEQQIVALQARLEDLHKAKLLSDDEFFALEDTIADHVEFEASMSTVTLELAQANEASSKLLKLVALSERIATDGSFARQARRKYV